MNRNALLLAVCLGTAAGARAGEKRGDAVDHVLLLSIDGFHDFDLTNYVASHPSSALASLVARGTVYTQAYSTGPSDSFPATLAIATGGSPSSTGIYYDSTWDDRLSRPGSAHSAQIGGGTVYVGAEIDALVDGQMAGNPGRHPDVVVQPDAGVVYTTAGSKICDHGGLDEQDRHVAMVIAGPRVRAGTVTRTPKNQ